VAILTRSSEAQQIKEIEDSFDTLKEMVGVAVKQETLDKARQLSLASVKSFSGESAGGFWIDGNGGFNMTAATKLSEPKGAQAKMRRVLQLLARETNAYMRDKMSPELKKELQGAKLTLRVRAGAVRVAGVRGDVLEIIPTWPRVKTKAEREELNEVKRGLGVLLGRRISLAYATHGDVMLFALGKSYRKQMNRLVQVARGKEVPSLKEVVNEEVGQRPIVSFLYMPVATTLEQSMRAADRVTQIPARLKDAFQKIIPPARPGQDIPITGRLVAKAPRLTWEMDIAPELVGLAVKAGVYWFRMQGSRRSVP
jgi:3'-phosphoadenosine 5'-phosphosulfate sulfotransferase